MPTWLPDYVVDTPVIPTNDTMEELFLTKYMVKSAKVEQVSGLLVTFGGTDVFKNNDGR